MVDEGRQTFRFDTFGDEAFWGDTLQLHRAIAGEDNGGVGPGVSPNTALDVGLKVDVEAVPAAVAQALSKGMVDLDDPASTLVLLKANAVVGLTGTFDGDELTSIGIQCAFCHSTVDDSFAPGIGKRLDGWPNRDLNVGAIISLAPDLSALTSLLDVDLATLKKVLASWGPGKFDAELFLDGKAFRPDGKTAATLLPPAYGLAGVNLHTYTGWGSVPYWNALVANLEMHGQGTFIDKRLDDDRFPIAQRAGFDEVRTPPDRDRVTGKLASLHFYQLALEAPRPKPVASTRTRPCAAASCSWAKRSAPIATSPRCTPSRAGTCIRPRRSASTTSSRSARLIGVTERPHCADWLHMPRAVSIMMVASRRCSTWSTTTTM